MNFMGYVKQYGSWASMADLYQTRQIPAYLEAVFGQNVRGSGLDCHWRVNTAGLPTSEIYASWILLGTTEPCMWWTRLSTSLVHANDTAEFLCPAMADAL